jgi:Putative zinc-finger
MMSCEDFQIALEKRRFGALSSEETRLLEAHLASCQVCQRFDHVSSTAEGIMKDSVHEQVQTIDWDGISRKLMRAIKRSQWELGAGAVALIAFIGTVALKQRGIFATEAWWLPFAMIAVFVIVLWRGLNERARRFDAPAGANGIEALRAEVDAQVSRIKSRSAWRYLLPCALIMPAGIGWNIGPEVLRGLAFAVWLGCQLDFIHLLYERFVLLPRLIKGRKAIG